MASGKPKKILLAACMRTQLSILIAMVKKPGQKRTVENSGGINQTRFDLLSFVYRTGLIRKP